MVFKHGLLGCLVIFNFTTISVFAQSLEDRCVGLVNGALIRAEFISNFWFDVGIHQLLCDFKGNKEESERALSQLNSVRREYAHCIAPAQERLVAYVGGEKQFDNFYAAIGNQISYLSVESPCARVNYLAQMTLGKNLTCDQQLYDQYRLHFLSLAKAYENISHKTFRRICDH